jgi:DNA helicase-2/ATP-dependent DNA helicase PcrA
VDVLAEALELGELVAGQIENVVLDLEGDADRLGEAADRLGYPRTFSIYDQADAQRLTGYVIRDLGLDAKRFTPRAVHATISKWKNELVDSQQAAMLASDIFARKHAEVYAEYQFRLQRAGAMDFDDLLMKTVQLFREHPDVLESYQQRFRHILIDEYQDTNMAQNELAVLLAKDSGEITAAIGPAE